MTETAERSGRIYHLALADEWAAAAEGGLYARSTIGRSLEEEGFIHCSFVSQVQEIADLLYFNRDDVVLLAIDASRLAAPVVVENLHGTDQSYPHVYGALPLAAVVRAVPVPMGPDGRLDVNAVIDWSPA